MSSVHVSIPWITDAQEAVKLAKGASDALSESGRLEDAHARLSSLLTGLRAAVASSGLISQVVDWPGRVPRPDVFRDLKEAQSLESRPLERLTRALEGYVREVNQDLVQTWSAHASSRLGSVQELLVLASVLRVVDDVAEQSIALEHVLGALARVQGALPTDESARLLADAEMRLAELEASLQPAEVRDFLMAAARGGASVELLTPDVVAWIRSHKALSSFRVTAGKPGVINE